MSDSKTLLLIDGHAVAYRAFFAIRNLSRSDGVPTNAVYGFIRMLEQMRQQWKPSHVCVVFDGGLAQERMDLLPEYKQQREPMPDDLRVQFDFINRFLSASGIHVELLEDQEADDVMATIAVGAASTGDVLIATSDKDMLQLVQDRIWIIPPTKSENRMGVQEVTGKTGVRPDQIAAWLALIGDTADNIGGVPGVGPKTAAKWLQTWDHLEGILSHREELPTRFAEVLLSHRDVVIRNLAMTTLKLDLPVGCDWNRWEVRPNNSDLLAFFKEMEFKSMAQALESPSLF